jgi:cytidylate kinase
MNVHPSLDTAASYLQVLAGRTGTGPEPAPAFPFVTISRESGAGGNSLGREVCRILNAEEDSHRPWCVIDGSIIDEMLRSRQLPDYLGRYLPEDRVSEFNACIGELLGLHPNLWDLVQHTHSLMRELAANGHVVLIGRGGNFVTSGLPGGVHVRLIAPLPFRTRHMMRIRHLGEEASERLNLEKDAARARYVRASFAADIADPIHYDLVLNTSRVALSVAAESLVEIIRHRRPAPASAGVRVQERPQVAARAE